MTHILDNPIYNALATGNRRFSFGTDQVKYLDREIGAFAGLQHNSPEELLTLRDFTPPKTTVVLFTPHPIEIPDGWNIKVNRVLLQMICTELKSDYEPDPVLQPLDQAHVPAMLELTRKTNPGPFFHRTIEFGKYFGVFAEGRLVAMTGQRLQPDPFTEVSAVCTDPDFTGRGYAALLVKNQVQQIIKSGRTAFLHVYPDNTGAVKLYEKTGFTVRREMMLYVMETE